jgi:hypothetical protein
VSGDASGPDDDEERYALAGVVQGCLASAERAWAEAFNLGRVLRRVLPDGGLIVRAEPCERWPVVRAELGASCAVAVADRLVSVDPGEWKGPESSGIDFDQWTADLALLDPVGFRVRPGVDYAAGYRRARVAAAALAGVLGRVPGWWVVDPDCWRDGTGIVRLTLTPGDAARLVEVLG